MIKVALTVAAGGAVGSVLRFLTSAWVVAQWPRHYYLATFAVNLIGCLAIGFLSALFLLRTDISLELRTGLTVGVLGGLTTFSSFSLEVLRLLEAGGGARDGIEQLQVLLHLRLARVVHRAKDAVEQIFLQADPAESPHLKPESNVV